MANDHGFPGNLGGLAVSIEMPVGDPAYQLQIDPRPTSEADGDERGTKRWYRQAKETKCGEMNGKGSQRPIVVLKRGNGPPGPRGAKGVPRCGRELEPRRRHRASPACHRETTQSCEGQRLRERDEPDAIDVHVRICGELPGRIPGVTRPGTRNS